MADVELVVKIPEEMYKKLLNKGAIMCLSGYEEIIANGTPLDDVLNKIRAEMEWIKSRNTDTGYRWWNNAISNCQHIIDHYKTESKEE